MFTNFKHEILASICYYFHFILFSCTVEKIQSLTIIILKKISMKNPRGFLFERCNKLRDKCSQFERSAAFLVQLHRLLFLGKLITDRAHRQLRNKYNKPYFALIKIFIFLEAFVCVIRAFYCQNLCSEFAGISLKK